MRFTFTASATSKEDAKTQIRSEANRDSPDWAKEEALKRIDETPLTAGHRIRVEMRGEPENRDTLELNVETSAT